MEKQVFSSILLRKKNEIFSPSSVNENIKKINSGTSKVPQPMKTITYIEKTS